MASILKTVSYPLIVLLTYAIAKKDWGIQKARPDLPRLKLHNMFFLSLLIGLYSLSWNHTFWWADLTYYSKLFCNGLPINESAGLNCIYYILHLFTNNIDILLFVVSALSTFLALLSYAKYEDAHPVSLLMLYLTPFFIETCQVNLKQSPACGLANLAIILFFKKRYLIAFALTAVASAFHVTALPILLLTFLAIRLVNLKRQRGTYFFIFCALACSVFYYNIIFRAIDYLGVYIPLLGKKLGEYTNADRMLELSSTGVIALKGMPYYLITIIGLWNRKKLKKIVSNYDSYLTVSLLASISYMLSYYSYWMSRIINYYWLTDLVFAGLLIKKMENKDNSIVIKFIICGMLFLLTFREMYQVYL